MLYSCSTPTKRRVTARVRSRMSSTEYTRVRSRTSVGAHPHVLQADNEAGCAVGAPLAADDVDGAGGVDHGRVVTSRSPRRRECATRPPHTCGQLARTERWHQLKTEKAYKASTRHGCAIRGQAQRCGTRAQSFYTHTHAHVEHTHAQKCINTHARTHTHTHTHTLAHTHTRKQTHMQTHTPRMCTRTLMQTDSCKETCRTCSSVCTIASPAGAFMYPTTEKGRHR
jgi:hypothetical protein